MLSVYVGLLVGLVGGVGYAVSNVDELSYFDNFWKRVALKASMILLLGSYGGLVGMMIGHAVGPAWPLFLFAFVASLCSTFNVFQ